MAEEIKETTVDETVENNESNAQADEISKDEQIQKLLLENAKLKRATDKATSEASSFKKQLREKQSADEIALQEKAEREAQREEQFQALVRENNINKMEKNFLALGYSSEQASKAATAQVDGDTDALFKIQAEVQQTMLKAQKAEWLKSVPQINAGVGEEKPNISREQFEKLSYAEEREFKAKYPETYKSYTS